VVGEVEKHRQVLCWRIRVTRVGQLRGWVPELIKERVDHRFYRGETLCRCVLQQSRDQIDRVRISLPEHLRTISSRTTAVRKEPSLTLLNG